MLKLWKTLFYNFYKLKIKYEWKIISYKLGWWELKQFRSLESNKFNKISYANSKNNSIISFSCYKEVNKPIN